MAGQEELVEMGQISKGEAQKMFEGFVIQAVSSGPAKASLKGVVASVIWDHEEQIATIVEELLPPK